MTKTLEFLVRGFGGLGLIAIASLLGCLLLVAVASWKVAGVVVGDFE